MTGLDFIFKGGTIAARIGFSQTIFTDLDIVVETDQGLDEALRSIPQQGVFQRVEENERTSCIQTALQIFLSINYRE